MDRSDLEDLKEMLEIVTTVAPLVIKAVLPTLTGEIGPALGKIYSGVTEFIDNETIKSIKRFEAAGLDITDAVALAMKSKSQSLDALTGVGRAHLATRKAA